jgi:hypothetical protein
VQIQRRPRSREKTKAASARLFNVEEYTVSISKRLYLQLGLPFGTSRHLPLPGRHQEHRILRHPFPQRGVHNHFIDFAKLCLFCILFFSIATDLSENVIYLFYFNFI